MKNEFNIGDHVLVSAECTGFGRPISGIVSKKEVFMGVVFYDVDYLEPAPYGLKGITVINPGMLIPQKQ